MSVQQQAINGEESLDNRAGPRQALVEFYKAFNNRNLQAMENNWLHSDEASMSNPLGGIKRGWDEIRQVYETIFMGDAQVYVEFHDYAIYQTENMFIAAGRERGRLTKNGQEIELHIRTSRVYLFEKAHWKQLHHHGSMDNPQLLETYQSLLLQR